MIYYENSKWKHVHMYLITVHNGYQYFELYTDFTFCIIA